MKITVKQLTRGAIIAALYATLTIVLAPISFDALQFRVSEVLTVLPFVMPEAVWGLTLGCLIANLIGHGTILDIIFGTLATFLAALTTSKIKKLWLAPLPAVIFNGTIVGMVLTLMTFEFSWKLYLLNAMCIMVSELVICYCGGVPLLVFINGMSSRYDYFK